MAEVAEVVWLLVSHSRSRCLAASRIWGGPNARVSASGQCKPSIKKRSRSSSQDLAGLI